MTKHFTEEKLLHSAQSLFETFYSVAKIALEDKPQLLESVGKFVRS